VIATLKRFLKHLLGREKTEVAIPQKSPKSPSMEEKTVETQCKIDETRRRVDEIDRELERLSKVDPAEISRTIVKSIKTQTIREANIKRQQSTLGYGLKGKFRPRPAHEKKTFDLRKKPENN